MKGFNRPMGSYEVSRQVVSDKHGQMQKYFRYAFIRGKI